MTRTRGSFNQEGSGGIMEPIRVDCGPWKKGDKFYFQFMSDLHIGAANVDYDLILKELSTAKARDAKIFVNGDVFDMILPQDHRRFRADVLHDRLRGRADVINAAMEFAEEILAPFASHIYMIGSGNHESAVEKHHSFDPIIMLLDRLKPHCPEGHEIAYGGYQGALCFRIGGTLKSKTLWVNGYYHHGAGGGGGAVSKGMIQFNRKNVWLDGFNFLWLGHIHTRTTNDSVSMSLDVARSKYVFTERKNFYTGAYMNTLQGQSQESVRTDGRKTNYAADAGLSPQALGGVLMTVEPGCNWRGNLEPNIKITH